MTDDPTELALDVMVQHVAAYVLDQASDEVDIIQRDFPKVGYEHRRQIAVSLETFAARLAPSYDQVTAAYEHLKGRAVMGADSDVNSGPGWYEVIHPTRAGEA